MNNKYTDWSACQNLGELTQEACWAQGRGEGPMWAGEEGWKQSGPKASPSKGTGRAATVMGHLPFWYLI